MTIIFGEGCSGKSSLALEIAKKQTSLKNKKVIYFALDNDKSLERKILSCPKIKYKYITSPIMLDIEFAIEEDTSFIVIDSINWIKSNSLKDIIRSLDYIELFYKVEVIAIYNTLRMVDVSSKILIDACKGTKMKMLATSKKSKKFTVKRESSNRG
jgi:adenosyl cobinamide kinase/adenosyl cobinamide phosphate guanylyltransferase